ncbi:MAG: LCP family protein, partial [Eubacterium sp.]
SGELKDSALVKNILLLGVDARSDDKADASRADSMMLISVDMKHRCIKMTSFLRDTWVYIPAHDGEQRLNAACTYGGYSGVVDTIEYNFGVEIDGYVVADFEMFKVLVDSIGGVEVEVTEKEAKEVTNHKKRYGNVKLEAGKQTLTGEQALAYCRIRKIDTDFMRTKRQRTVMQSIISGMKSSNLFSLYGMAYKSAPYIETDLSKSQIKSLAVCAAACLSGKMVETRVPFEGTWEYANKNGASVIAINVDDNKKELIDYIYDKSADDIIAEQKADK